MTEKFYLGFRQTWPRPVAGWVVAGPFDTYKEAKEDRHASRAWDCELSEIFNANSKAEAQQKLEQKNSF